MRTKLYSLAVIGLTFGTTGCYDAVREGAVNGIGDATENGIELALGFWTVALDAGLTVLRNFLTGA